VIYFPHKPHSLIKWATGHHVTLSRTNSQVWQALPVPEDRSGDRHIQGIRRLHVVPSSFSSTITNIAHDGSTPSPDSVQASRLEQLILPVMCGACVQHDKRAVNDRSLIDTGRTTMVQRPHKTLPGLNLLSHTWLLPMLATNNYTFWYLHISHRLRAYTT